jgi:hypothetical protein
MNRSGVVPVRLQIPPEADGSLIGVKIVD